LAFFKSDGAPNEGDDDETFSSHSSVAVFLFVVVGLEDSGTRFLMLMIGLTAFACDRLNISEVMMVSFFCSPAECA
jgi:hypothetical protein